MAQPILLIDSDPQLVREWTQGLEQVGLQLHVQADVEKALDWAISHQPGVILLSVELPGVNGFLVCKTIKRTAELSQTPVFILSRDATPDIFEQHKQLKTRADEYFNKPLDVGRLIAAIGRFVPVSTDDLEPSGGTDDLIFIDEIETGTVVQQRVDGRDSVSRQSITSSHPDDFDDGGDGATMVLTGDLMGLDQTNIRDTSGFAAQTQAADERTQTSQTLAENDALDELYDTQMVTPRQRQPSRLSLAPSSLGSDDDLRTDPPPPAQSPPQERVVPQVSKSRLPEAAKVNTNAGLSSREFLDLREQLNKKDKENLDLRDQLSVRDKQLLAARDKTIALERIQADFQDKIIKLERINADLTESVEQLTSDKDVITKRADGYKSRLESAESKIKKLEESLDGEKKGRAEELENLRQAHAKARDQASSEHEMTMATLLANHRDEQAQSKESYELQLNQLQAKLDNTVDELKRQHEAQSRDRESRHQDALERLRIDAEQNKTDALAVLKQELTEEMQGRLIEAEVRREDELNQAQEAHMQALVRLRHELDAQHASHVKDIETQHALVSKQMDEQHAKDVTMLGRKLSESDSQLSETQSALADLKQSSAAELADLKQSSAAELADLKQSSAAELADLKQSSAAELADLKQSSATELADLRQRTSSELTMAQQKFADIEEQLSMRIAVLESELETTSLGLKQTEAALTQSEASNENLTRTRQDQMAQIGRLESDLTAINQRMDAIVQKVTLDEQLLERVRQSFAIASAALEEQRTNTIDK